MFDNYVGYLNTLIFYQTEDIKDQIINSNSPVEKKILINKRNILLKSKYNERIKEAYEISPFKSSDFTQQKYITKYLILKNQT